MTSIGSLHSAFATDRQDAEGRYLDRVFQVEGTVIRAGESMYATPAIEVSDQPGGQIKAVFVLPYGRKIKASFRHLEDVRPGQLIAISGECRMVSDPGGVLVFKECVLLAAPGSAGS